MAKEVNSEILRRMIHHLRPVMRSERAQSMHHHMESAPGVSDNFARHRANAPAGNGRSNSRAVPRCAYSGGISLKAKSTLMPRERWMISARKYQMIDTARTPNTT